MTTTIEDILLFQFRGHGQLSSGPIETLHGTWLWLSWTWHWQMGTSAKVGNWFQLCSYTGNLRMRWWITPLGWTLWILGGRGGQHALQLLFLARFRRSKITKGATIERQKNSKKSNRNIKNRDAPTLKLATNGLEVFVNAPWASFCAMDVSSNITLRLLLIHKYCN